MLEVDVDIVVLKKFVRKIKSLQFLCHCWCCADNDYHDDFNDIMLMSQFPNGLYHNKIEQKFKEMTDIHQRSEKCIINIALHCMPK